MKESSLTTFPFFVFVLLLNTIVMFVFALLLVCLLFGVKILFAPLFQIVTSFFVPVGILVPLVMIYSNGSHMQLLQDRRCWHQRTATTTYPMKDKAQIRI
jgi:hypothetical protein